MFKRSDGGELTGLDILALFVFFALALTLIPDKLEMANKSAGEGLSTLQYVLVATLIGLAVFRAIRSLITRTKD